MIRLFLISIISVFITACNSNDSSPRLVKLAGSTMGTSYNISYIASDSKSVDPVQLQNSIDEVLKSIDSSMSTYKKDSELSQFNYQTPETYLEISGITSSVLSKSIWLSEFTGGAFDVTVAPLVDLWGFGGDSKKRNRPVPQDEVKEALGSVGMDRFKLRSNRITKVADVKIDLSAIAKGFAVDQVALVLDDYGVTRYLVEIGGELVARGKSIRNTSWVLGIESPDKMGRSVYTVVHLDDAALATSGDYRNFFEVDGKRYSHTIDPHTGRPVTHSLASVSVIAEDCMFADGMATALMVMGEQKGYNFAQEHDISAFFIYREGERLLTKHTKNFEQYLK